MRAKFREAARRGVGALYRTAAGARARAGHLVMRGRAVPAYLATRRHRPDVRHATILVQTDVDRYWGRHLVRSEPFASVRESRRYLEWRFHAYPWYRELMELWGDHDGETILDYGCGPGDDTIGFLLYTSARQVIGVDISRRALELTRRRIALHRITGDRVELVRISDADAALSLDDGSVDFVHCSGVLHHTTAPDRILRELHRVLRPRGRMNVMVYNRLSVWFHLYAAYVLKVIGGDPAPIEDVFRRSTDGAECPVSVPYEPAEFLALATEGGFEGRFAGGYLSQLELDLLNRFGPQAAADKRLASEHRSFLEAVELGDHGLPHSNGLLAGIGGVYHLQRR